MESGRLKVLVSAAILAIGLLATIAAVGSSSPADSSSGIIIDFGDYEVVYSSQDGSLVPLDALDRACGSEGYVLDVSDDTVSSIDGRISGSDRSWALFVVEQGSRSWTRLSGSESAISSYTAVCYGYCTAEGEPAPAVDSTGYSFYSYEVPSRIVSLAPSCTETLCYVGGEDLIVGTDLYSNFPRSIVSGQDSGAISIVGGFTNPSYESVLSLDPDLVVCVGTQSSHVQMASKLRSVGIDVLVLDGGESISAVMNNIFEAGAVLGTKDSAVSGIHGLQETMQKVSEVISASGAEDKRVMIALSAVKSPWVSGSGTYADDIMSMVGAVNIYSGDSGWVQVNSETIARYDPECIIIVTSDYDATQSDYDAMLSSMSSEWRSSTAYASGEVYLFTGDAADCASRPGPRMAQLSELIGRAVHGEAFGDGGLPKFIGDDYTQYLTIAEGNGE